MVIRDIKRMATQLLEGCNVVPNKDTRVLEISSICMAIIESNDNRRVIELNEELSLKLVS